MTEIRRIEPGEAVRFLRLLCDVFELDFSRARPLYFNDPMYEVTQRWALFHDGELTAILSAAPLDFQAGRCLGIAGVATRPEYRGQGFAGELLEAMMLVNSRCSQTGYLLFAKDERLYRAHGFQTADVTWRAPFATEAYAPSPRGIKFVDMVAQYTKWSTEKPNRLLRNDRRWKLWKHHLRSTWVCGNGYLCNEGDTVREIITPSPPPQWPILPSFQWLGLKSMAESMQLPLGPGIREASLMLRNFGERPEFFLTDQF